MLPPLDMKPITQPRRSVRDSAGSYREGHRLHDRLTESHHEAEGDERRQRGSGRTEGGGHPERGETHQQ